MKAISMLYRKYNFLIDTWGMFSPVNPTVIIQSDDWGGVGMPNLKALKVLQDKGYEVGKSLWDYYGLESEKDLIALGDLLNSIKDRDGCPACFTANFIMANADLKRMESENYRSFYAIPIEEGFPYPWEENLFSVYRSLIYKKLFYPGLHGYTHFSPFGLIQGLKDNGDFGRRTRDLVSNYLSYSSSFTPEYNFALVSRNHGCEHFIEDKLQEEWIEKGIILFKNAFDMPPLTVCAPGYRFNSTTLKIWRSLGINVVQGGSGAYPVFKNGLFFLSRNVHFEPALEGGKALNKALKKAVSLIEAGLVVVICTHSINYISRYLGKQQESLSGLKQLLSSLLVRYPGIHFTNDVEFFKAYQIRDKNWFRNPTIKEVVNRQNFNK